MADAEILDLEEGSGETGEICNLCLVGRILSPKTLNPTAIISVVTSVWKTRASFSVVPWQNNTFLFRFEDEKDRDSILHEGPWSIINNLLILNPFKGRRFGKLLAMETSTDGMLLGRSFLRVRVAVKIIDPLPKGFWLGRKPESNGDLRISYKYEKLSDYCYDCGRIGHDNRRCRFVNREDGMNSGYGPKLCIERVDEAEIRVNQLLSRRPESMTRSNGACTDSLLGERVAIQNPNQNHPQPKGVMGVMATFLEPCWCPPIARRQSAKNDRTLDGESDLVPIEVVMEEFAIQKGLVAGPKQPPPEWLALWWNNDVSVDVEVANKNVMHTVISSLVDSRCWASTLVYGNPTHAEKELVWNMIRGIAYSENVPWMCIGDFNQVLSVEDKRGGNIPKLGRIRVFREMLEDCGLTDLECKGPRFMWRNNRNEGDFIMERIDIAFANARWRETFDTALVMVEVAVGSDHSPLLLNTDFSLNKVKKSFKFESFWTTEEACKQIIADTWAQNVCEVGFNPELYVEEKVVIKKLADLWQKDFMFWHQRSRVNWLRMGDRNTRFFHLTTIRRRQRNQIAKLKDENGEWQTDHVLIANTIQSHFSKLYAHPPSRELEDIISLVDPVVSDEVNAALTKPVSMDEVVGDDVFTEVKEFFQNGDILREMNHTNVALIPKVSNPESMSQFQEEVQKERLCAIKMDLNKAYDRLCWDFLFAVLKKMGFNETWIGWIKECASTVKYSINANGEQVCNIIPNRGLRQGDPLSPYCC
ncbi:hypothetical protein RHSIM_RhsimUnG0075100 [Rhododendron simsii]|uniref:CCHC-type domain-containing protein n=1 Tax=Rhododendron simsii TaxID=118357 RepID=A0A834FWZ4_RHOSS|nr:hypothetical protein RHSIM_RhsimUnG0075100 [Rhododendron simsii]